MPDEKKQSKFPSEVIDLPSQGKLYPEDHPCSNGQIEIKYMTAREEDILTSANLIKKGVVIQRLLVSLILTPGVTSDDLIIGDKNAVMVASRILAYGGQDFETSDTEKGRISDFPQSVGYLIGSSNKRMFTNITNGEIHYPENDNKCEEWKMQRAAQLSHANHMSITVRTYGISGLQAGDSLYLQLPRVSQWMGQGLAPSYDKLFSDVWVIKKLVHRIDTNQESSSYVCDLELINTRLNPLGQELPTNEKFVHYEYPTTPQAKDWDGPTGGSDLEPDPVLFTRITPLFKEPQSL